MSAAVRNALEDLLRTDPQFVTDMQAAGLGMTGQAVVPTVLRGNRRFDQLGQEHYPCWLLERGDSRGASHGNDGGDPQGLILGSDHQDWMTGHELSLVWHQQDYDTALTQREQIVPAVVRLLLRNPGLGDAHLAFVSNEINDRSYRHPTHTVTLLIEAHTTIERDAP